MRTDFDRLAAGHDDVVVDLARTEALDGSGVGALVYTFKRLVATGNRLTVRNVSGQPLNLLNESGLLRTLSNEHRDGFLRSAWRRVQPRPPTVAAVGETTAGHAAQTSVDEAAAHDRAKGAA